MNLIYRGKNTVGNWIYGSRVEIKYKGADTIGIIQNGKTYAENEYGEFLIPMVFVKEETVGVSMKIEDWNEKVIFSKDIVKVTDRCNPSFYFISVVHFTNYGLVIQPPKRLRKNYEMFWHISEAKHLWKVEILGNIFDNVDSIDYLLKGTIEG